MRGARIAPLARLEPGEQFARVPLAILIDKQLSRTARRGYIALALFRTGLGYSRASVRTLSRASGLNRGNVQKGLRELENRFHITACGATGRGVQRYFLGGQTTPAAPDSGTKNTPKSTESYPPYPQNGQKRCHSQRAAFWATTMPHRAAKWAKNDAPNRPKTMPLLHESFKNLRISERAARRLCRLHSQPPRGHTKAEARCTCSTCSALKAAGVDFGKPAAKSCPQGKGEAGGGTTYETALATTAPRWARPSRKTTGRPKPSGLAALACFRPTSRTMLLCPKYREGKQVAMMTYPQWRTSLFFAR